MNTQEVAKKLISMCREGKLREAIVALYSPNVVSIEGFDWPGSGIPRECRGLDAVLAKADWWLSNHTVHGTSVSEPFMALDKFAVRFDFDVTFKPTGERKPSGEIAIYTVQGGKVVHEEFLYVV